MRLVSWNVENAMRCIGELRGIVQQLGSPDVLCLQELRVRRHDAEAVHALEHAIPGYRCHHSLPRDPRNVTFRGGRMYGVATYVKGRWRSQVPDWDLEGRVVVVRRGALAVVNVYAVNGIAKPYYEPDGRVVGDRHAFKRRFQACVLDLGRALRRECGVIIAGDWNVSRTAQDTHPRLRTESPHALARAELNDRLDAEGFVDVWRAHHPATRAYSWFNPRSRGLDAARVDYVVVSADLAPRVRAASILDRLPWSDHAPVSVEL